MSKQIQQYTVKADRETGEWVEEAKHVGVVELSAWHAKQDTAEAHFDTYEFEDETRAIEVVWID